MGHVHMDFSTRKNLARVGFPTSAKMSPTNSKNPIESRIRESILFFKGQIPLETLKLGVSKFCMDTALRYTPVRHKQAWRFRNFG